MFEFRCRIDRSIECSVSSAPRRRDASGRRVLTRLFCYEGSLEEMDIFVSEFTGFAAAGRGWRPPRISLYIT